MAESHCYWCGDTRDPCEHQARPARVSGQPYFTSTAAVSVEDQCPLCLTTHLGVADSIIMPGDAVIAVPWAKGRLRKCGGNS